MLSKRLYSNEKQAKKVYDTLNYPTNEINFINCLNDMAKLTIYFLMYSGVPKEVIPLVLEKTKTYTVNDIKRNVFKATKKGKECIICGNPKNLTLHHIKPIKEYPELQYRYGNLKVICRNCHDNIHSWED